VDSRRGVDVLLSFALIVCLAVLAWRAVRGLETSMLSVGVPRQAVGSQAGDKLKGKANEAGRKAQNAVGNTSQLPSPQDVRHSHRQKRSI